MAPLEQPCFVPRSVYTSALTAARAPCSSGMTTRSLRTAGFAASPMEGSGGSGMTNLLLGPLLQCLEAATLGMPFEVWKTRMGRFRNEGAIEAFKNVYEKGGGARAFWAGLDAKLFESATKGAILMYSKESINASLLAGGTDPFLAGIAAGAGGGVCQVAVMGPCTFLVTGAVTSGSKMSTMERARQTWNRSGVKGFYPGGTALAFRQASNWASRQGFTEGVRERFKVLFHGDSKAKLTKAEEVGAGIVGGTLACWNHPFEVARIEAQARAAAGQPALSMPGVMKLVVAESGFTGLFTGLVPRVCLGIWQTLFMVTGAKLVKEILDVK